jgi:alpha-soluble NSF attachment protein
MGDYTGKGKALMEKADKKLSSWSMFGNKYEDAAELIEKACNQFKLGKAWAEGGRAYEKLADVHIKLDSVHEAASAYVEAAKCYQKTSKTDVLRALHKAVEYFTAMGRLSMAAKNLREVGETLEKEGKKQDSIEFFRQAGDLFSGEEQTSEANKCRLKVAQFSAELGQYGEAISIYEDVAKRCVDNNLLKYSAKGYLLNAGICHLCASDVMAFKGALERYEDIDLNFQGSREGNLFKDLAEASEAGDVDKFTDAIAEFDSMTRLDQWKTTLLLRAKKRIEARDQEDEEDFT